jgi:hypothetical protein
MGRDESKDAGILDLDNLSETESFVRVEWRLLKETADR